MRSRAWAADKSAPLGGRFGFFLYYFEIVFGLGGIAVVNLALASLQIGVAQEQVGIE